MLINVRYILLVMFTFYGLSNAGAATLDYEVYALQGEGKRELLGKGTKEYELADVVVVEKTKGGVTSWSKSVLIWEDFSVGASIYKERPLTGFGLWIKRPGNGFSWDWFDIEDGAVFRKLQGGGKVRVETEKLEGSEELLAVEFLTDVTLRGSFSSWMFSTEDTHHLVIKKGSVLMLGN
jgi:hypothetical protein